MKLAVALFTVYVVWGSTYLAIAVADRTLPPLLMLSVRFLHRRRGPLRLVAPARRPRRRPSLRQWGAAAVVGAALLVVDTGGVAWAEQRVASGIAALLVASVPLFIAVLDRVCFGMRMPVGAPPASRVGLLGVGLLVGAARHIDPLGAAVLLLASFAWAAGSAYARVAPLPEHAALGRDADAHRRRGLGVLGVASASARATAVGAPRSARSLPRRLRLAVAFTAYGWLLQNAPSSLVSTYAYVNPAVAVFLGWLFVGEHVGPRGDRRRPRRSSRRSGCSLFGHERRVAPEPVAEALAAVHPPPGGAQASSSAGRPRLV